MRWPCTPEAEDILRELLEQKYNTAQLVELAARLGIDVPTGVRSKYDRAGDLIDSATTTQLIELAKNVLGQGRVRPLPRPDLNPTVARLRILCEEKLTPVVSQTSNSSVLAQSNHIDQSGDATAMVSVERGWSIFISHSSKDAELATLFVEEVLERSLGISANSIFFSSRKPSPIPTGADMSPFIRDALKNATVVVALVSQNFYESPYCMAELGAAWMAQTLHPLLFPPLTFSELKGVLGGVQALRVNELEALEALGDDLLRRLSLQSPPSTQRRTKLDGFLTGVSKLLAPSVSSTGGVSKSAGAKKRTGK